MFDNDKCIYNISMITFTTSRYKHDKYGQIEQDSYHYGNEITNSHCKICWYIYYISRADNNVHVSWMETLYIYDFNRFYVYNVCVHITMYMWDCLLI